MTNYLLLCLNCDHEWFVAENQVDDARCPCCGHQGDDVALIADDAEHDQFNSDAEADADVLASAGWGTDEDYGHYGDDYHDEMGDSF